MEAQRRRPGRPLQLEGAPDLAAATSVGALLRTPFADRPKPFTEKQCRCAGFPCLSVGKLCTLATVGVW